MANDEEVFAELLSQAPLYQKSETVTLTGALARSSEEGKFALMQSDGSVITLDIDAVKSHTAIGSSFGQQIVQVEVDAERVPNEMTGQPPNANPFYLSQKGTPADQDSWGTGWVESQKPVRDLLKAVEDHPPHYLLPPPTRHMHMLSYAGTKPNVGLPFDVHFPPWSRGPRDILMPIQPDYIYMSPYADYLPFLLATEHQAPASALNQI